MLGSLGVKVTCVDVLSDLQMRLEMVLDQRHPRLSKTPHIKPPRFPFSRNFPGGVRNARVFFLQFIAQVWPGSYWRILRILGFCHVGIQEDWEKIISYIFDLSKNAKCFEFLFPGSPGVSALRRTPLWGESMDKFTFPLLSLLTRTDTFSPWECHTILSIDFFGKCFCANKQKDTFLVQISCCKPTQHQDNLWNCPLFFPLLIKYALTHLSSMTGLRKLTAGCPIRKT